MEERKEKERDMGRGRGGERMGELERRTGEGI